MEIELITGATAFEAGKNVLKQIDVNDFDKQNLVVVPDSFSMQAESLIFDVLNIKSTFNIEVVGVSKLASNILRSNNIAFERISGLEEVFNIFQAVKKNEENFEYFQKCGVDFCIKILQIIKQFKSCKILPDRIKPVGDTMLDKKMHDLKLIYQSYDQLLGDKLDLSKLFEFCVQNAETNVDLSNINLYFINFDSFSLEINSFICKLAGIVNKVCIGVAKPVSLGNAFIYENDIKEKTTKLAKEFGVLVKIENLPTALQGERLKMVENLFSFDVKEGKSDFFVKILAKNRQDEIEFVAKYIKNHVFKGARYKDFAIAVPNKDYYQQIKLVFNQYQIANYCDDAIDLSQTILGQFLLKIIQIAKLGFDKASLQYLVNCPLFEIENKKQILHDILYFNVDSKQEFLDRFECLHEVCKQIDLLKKSTKMSDFSSILKQFVAEVCEKHRKLLEEIVAKEYLKKIDENSQSPNLIQKVLDKLSDLGQEQKIELADFESLFLLALKSVKVETVPSYVDAVYVGDATDSYFEDVENLFILGATANNLPRTQNDTGIIDDDDISKLRFDFALEPEIKVLNRRSRLKIFELLQHAKNKLFVSVPMVEENKQSQEAGFVGDLSKMFGNNTVHTAFAEEINQPVSYEDKLDRLCFYIGCDDNLATAYTNLKTKEKLPPEFDGALRASIKTILPNVATSFSLSKEKARDFMMRNNTISASQLETYFACPFKHFMSYGMKIRQPETIEPNKRLFGTFEHALLKIFVEQNSNLNLTEKQIEDFIDKSFLDIARQVYDEKVLKQNHFVLYLKNESKIILKNIVSEQKYSSFRPILLEERIFKHFDNFNLVGFVDRTDKCGDYFRIIDYKTGKTENIKKELFYGKKLQLFLYGKSMQEKLSLKCGGVYYFDCQTKYTKVGGNANLFNGLTKKDNDVVAMTDARLDEEGIKSNLIGMSRKKNVKDGEFAFKNGNSVENFDDLFEYASEISNMAVKEIQDGLIDGKPLFGECQFCPYQSVCGHTDLQGYRYMQSVKDENLKRKNDGTD